MAQAKTVIQNHAKTAFLGQELGHGATLQVFTGNLSSTKVDVIVNSTGHDMNLSVGALSSDLLDKAGAYLQEECKTLGGLKDGQVKMTKGYGLPCRKVLHVCLPTWDDDKGEQNLKSIITTCLLKAEDVRAESVSFPALGAGNLGYPCEKVAKCLKAACKDFASTSCHGKVKTIKVVIFTKDLSTKASFEKVLGGQLLSAYHSEEPDYSSWAAGIDYDNLTNNKDIVVSMETKEWQDCVKSFKETVDNADVWEILEVTRVQNPGAYKLYKTQREVVAKKLGTRERDVEKTLWHGTKQESVIYIARHKFDRAYAGTAVGALNGQGCYFALNAQYSLSYCRMNKDGEKFMIRVKVITGDYTKGKEDMKAAPYKMNSKIDQYDSVVDDESNPTIFVVFHDASAYPEYIIKFRHAASPQSSAYTPPSTPPPLFSSTLPLSLPPRPARRPTATGSAEEASTEQASTEQASTTNQTT